MEKNQFPEQELPEEDLQSIPVSMEPLIPEPSAPQETEVPDAQPAPMPQPEVLPEEEALPRELPAEEPPHRDGAAFMAAIPDVEEDYPQPALPAEETLSPEGVEMPPSLPGSVPEEPDLDFLEEPSVPELEQLQQETLDQEYRDNGREFDALYGAPAAAEKDPPTLFSQPPRKGRPKRKKGEGLFGIPNILVTVVWLALILAIGVTLGRMLWVCAADVLAFGREDKAVTITVYEADTMDDIVDKLYNAGLIRYKSLFNLYADISDAEEDIQPGIYDLNTRYDYHALVNFMSPRSSREVVEGVMIPEGYTCQQIFALLEENKVCTAQDIAAYAAEGELGDYWFLEYVERGTENCLEGFLFPDTYDFYKNSSPKEVLTKLLDNFETKFNEEMRGQIDVLNDSVTGGGYTVREIVIVASLIEKESAAPAESPAIAGVIYNRLFNWNYPAYLNIDAAIVYAQGGDAETIDTNLDSPYNTYTHLGLTPGPIANPSLSSLKAALNPESHNYYYYVLNPATGMHQFSTTQAEHDAWISEFYNN